MTKYHIKDDGYPGVCKAQAGGCPKGEDSEHYSNREEARAAYESSMEPNLISRFEKCPNKSHIDSQFKEKIARQRRVDDAILNANPRKTAIQAIYEDLPKTWDGTTKYGYYIHPDFRAALPNDEDLACYVETVQLEDKLSSFEKDSAVVNYNDKNGLLFTLTKRIRTTMLFTRLVAMRSKAQ